MRQIVVPALADSHNAATRRKCIRGSVPNSPLMNFARKSREQLALLGMIGILVLSGWLATRSIHIEQRPLNPATNPSPYGYTWSLALFAVPMAVLGTWVLRFHPVPSARKAFLLTIAILVPLGFGLDIFFGLTFFKFPNPEATLGINLPGYRYGQGWAMAIPFEEFVFYASGFVTILLVYIWSEAVMFPEFTLEESYRVPRVFGRLRNSFLTWMIVGAMLFGLSLLIRNTGDRADAGGFPGYFLFLVVGSVIPSGACSPVAFPVINWRAMTVTYLFILLISMFWEASLGVPYQWWDYQPSQMMGIHFKPFCNLPLEAVLVWTFATWTTVIIYETLLTAKITGRGLRGILSVLLTPPANIAPLRTSARTPLGASPQPPR